RRERGPGRTRRGAPAESLPLPRLHRPRLAPPPRAREDVGRRARRVPLVGRPLEPRPRGARAVAPPRRRPDRDAARALRPGARRRRPRADGARRVTATATDRLTAPFRGLAPFDESELDALLFFGRETETEIAVANLLAARLTILYGPSGVGKSSLLR